MLRLYDILSIIRDMPPALPCASQSARQFSIHVKVLQDFWGLAALRSPLIGILHGIIKYHLEEHGFWWMTLRNLDL
jgi:hypothetical protein